MTWMTWVAGEIFLLAMCIALMLRLLYTWRGIGFLVLFAFAQVIYATFFLCWLVLT